MAKTKNKDAVTDEQPVDEPLYARGDALPVRDGEIVRDAKPRPQSNPVESTAHNAPDWQQS